MQRSPLIHEVARAAGVSVATVSRALNGKGPLRDETRQRVLAAVEELGYVPHGAARSLSSRRTMNFGVLLPDVHGEFFSEIVRGIDLAARAAGYHVLVSGSHSDLAETAAVLQALHGRIDGLVLMTPGAAGSWLRRHLPRHVPVVLLNHSGPSDEHAAIGVDNALGGRLAVEHLLALGHRRIAIIRGPEHNEDAAERWRAYRETLTAHGVSAPPELALPGDFDEPSGYRAGQQLAGLAARPTAVFAANDAMAIGCLAALREHGLAVPGDVSLVGFDDIPVARYLTPALTTVRVDIAALGARAVERLLAAIAGPGDAAPQDDLVAHDLVAHDLVAPSLAIRASTAAVPAAA
jgi:LacI family transcriptional regulator